MRLRRTALLHNRPSYSAKAEYPVRCERSPLSPAPRNTGSPAFAGDDSRRCGASAFFKHAFAFPRRDAPEFCVNDPPKEGVALP
jgi:hypothetical protein